MTINHNIFLNLSYKTPKSIPQRLVSSSPAASHRLGSVQVTGMWPRNTSAFPLASNLCIHLSADAALRDQSHYSYQTVNMFMAAVKPAPLT